MFGAGQCGATVRRIIKRKEPANAAKDCRTFPVIVACCAVYGQSAENHPQFEVASVKSIGEGPSREQPQTTPTSLTIRDASLAFFIQWAYDVRRDQINHPTWLDTERYDVMAKTAGPSTESQLRQMLQTLLAERFRLQFHHETKSLPSTKW